MCKIPKYLHDYLKKTENRRKMLEKCGKNAFLDPDRLKFPVMNHTTCKYDIRLIDCAIALAALHKNYPILNKAKALKAKLLSGKIESVSTIGSIERTEVFNRSTHTDEFPSNKPYII